MSINISFSEFNEIFCNTVGAISEKYTAFSEKFYILTEMLIRENEKTNLTAIKDAQGIVLKHYADCILIDKYIPKGAKMIDVGCGGGFPTLPISIIRDDVTITALDSTAKKLEFVKKVSSELSLKVEVLPRRAEEIGREANYRERYNAVTARAVCALNLLSELCIPLVKQGGVFVAMKGSSGHEELEAARSAIRKLGGIPKEYVSKLGDMERHIIVTQKNSQTPKEYPRSYSKMLKSPL